MPTKSRAELTAELDNLAAWLPTMLKTAPDADQMDAFAKRAELIENSAARIDQSYVHKVVQRILSDNCMIPTDEGPCA